MKSTEEKYINKAQYYTNSRGKKIELPGSMVILLPLGVNTVEDSEN